MKEEFIKKAIEVHTDNMIFQIRICHNLREIVIICKEHGEFLQLLKTHKRGNGVW